MKYEFVSITRYTIFTWLIAWDIFSSETESLTKLFSKLSRRKADSSNKSLCINNLLDFNYCVNYEGGVHNATYTMNHGKIFHRVRIFQDSTLSHNKIMKMCRIQDYAVMKTIQILLSFSIQNRLSNYIQYYLGYKNYEFHVGRHF